MTSPTSSPATQLSQWRNWRIWVYGLLSWLIPYLTAFAFFDPKDGLMIALPLFKSIMIVVGGAAGCGLLVLAFRHIRPSWQAGLTLGLFWLLLNWLLDIALLLPMSGQSLPDYASAIGLRYLLLPMIATAMGAVAAKR